MRVAWNLKIFFYFSSVESICRKGIAGTEHKVKFFFKLNLMFMEFSLRLSYCFRKLIIVTLLFQHLEFKEEIYFLKFQCMLNMQLTIYQGTKRKSPDSGLSGTRWLW